MAALVANGASGQSGPALRLLEGGQSASPVVDPKPSNLEDQVRNTRRQAARTLRAMQAMGVGSTTWPSDVVSRLAHLDCLTARYLIEPNTSTTADASRAVQELSQIERWLFGRLGASARADVRRAQMQVRVADEELVLPLLVPGRVPITKAVGDYTLAAGISAVSDLQLQRIAERLGIRPQSTPGGRKVIESDLIFLLSDDQMVGVLASTLDDDTLSLLADMVRGTLSDRTRDSLAAYDPVQIAVGAEGVHTMVTAAASLRDCGLAFARCPVHGARLWVPVDLQHRLDGVLRVFGL